MLSSFNMNVSSEHLHQNSNSQQQKYTAEQLRSMVNQYFDLRESSGRTDEIRTKLITLRDMSPKYRDIINAEAKLQRQARGIQENQFPK